MKVSGQAQVLTHEPSIAVHRNQMTISQLAVNCLMWTNPDFKIYSKLWYMVCILINACIWDQFLIYKSVVLNDWMLCVYGMIYLRFLHRAFWSTFSVYSHSSVTSPWWHWNSFAIGESSKFPKYWTLEIQIFQLAWCLQKWIISF